MRAVNLNNVVVPDQWEAAVEKAKQAWADDAGQSNTFTAIWTLLKENMASVSHGKCWYCEIRQVRTDNAVDHYRPKSKYPWHAYARENFRYACTFCNSRRRDPSTGKVKGKGDLFPLFDPSRMAQCEAEIQFEQPKLLDPCQATDCALLDFLVDGTSCPRNPEDPEQRERVLESIEHYHLNHSALRQLRKIRANQIEEWIRNANNIVLVKGEAAAWKDKSFNSMINDITRSMAEDAELSTFARRVVTMHRSKRWVETYLLGL